MGFADLPDALGSPAVPLLEGYVLRGGAEQWLAGHIVPAAGPLLQPFGKGAQVPLLPGPRQGGSHGHVVQGVFRAEAPRFQHVVEGAAAGGEEGEGAAQVEDVPPEFPALGQARHGLVHHGVEDAGGDVLLPGPLVQERLHVALGENSAAGGDGVELFVFLRQVVQFLKAHLHQGGHLVDEGPGASGAGAVHPHLEAPGEEEDLGVLASQLDDGVRLRPEAPDGDALGIDLLDEGEAQLLCQAHPGAAGEGELHGLPRIAVQESRQQLPQVFRHPGEVPQVFGIEQLSRLVQHGALEGGGAHVDAQLLHGCFPLRSIMGPGFPTNPLPAPSPWPA